MASLGELFVKVGADIQGFKTAMGDVNTQLKTLDSEATKATAGFDALSGRLTAVGTALTASLTLPIVGVGVASTQMFAAFQSAMNEVEAKSGITGAALEALKTQAMQLGAETKFSATEAASGMAELAAKGFSAQQIMAAMPGIMSLAATETMSVATASDIATSAMGAYGIEASGVQQVADALALAAASTSSSVADLGQSLKFVAPIANLAGVSFEMTTAALGLLSDAGIRGEQAGTGLRGVLAALANPSTDAANSLSLLGVSTKTASGEMRPLDQILVDLKESGASASDVFNIFGRESSAAASVLIDKGGPALLDFTQKVQDSDGAAKQMATTMNQGLKGAFEQMKGSMETAGIALGTILAPAIQAGALALKEIADWLTAAVQWFGQLPGPIQVAAGAVAILLASLGPLLLIAGQLVSAWTAVAPLFGAAGIGGALTALSGTISTVVTAIGTGMTGALVGGEAALLLFGQVVAAVAAAFAAWKLAEWAYANVEPFRHAVDAVWGAISAVVGLVGDIAITAFGAWWELVKAIGGFLWDLFKPAIDAVWTSLTGIASVITSVVSVAFQALLNGIQSITSTVNAFRTTLQEWTGTADQTKIKSENVKTAYDQMGEAARLATQPTKDLDKASGTKGFAGAAGDAESATTKWKKELEELKKKALKEAKEEAAKFNLTLQATAKAADEAYDENEKLRLKLIDLKADLMQGRDATWAMETALNDMKDMLGDVGTETTALKNLVVPEFAQMSTKVTDYKTKVGDLAGAYTSLGITTKAELEKIVADTETAKNAILGDEDATEWAKKTAIYKALEAQRNLSLALGTDLPQDQKDLMEKLKTETDTGLNGEGGLKSKWETFSTSVSTTISNFAQSIGQSLFDGDLSFGEKVKKMLTDLGSAIVTLMIEPWTAAIAKWITDAVDGLLGGAFNKIGGWLGDAASKISGIFNGTSSVPTPSAPVPTNPTIPGGGGGSGAPASGGGFAGAVGIISGITTAVTGVIGLFQNKGMNAALDVIVKHTLQTVMILETTFYWVTDFLGQIRNGILDSKDRLDWMSTSMTDGLASIHQRLFELRSFGIQVDLAGATGVPVTVADFSDTALDRFTRVMSKAVVIHTTVNLDGKVIADGVVEHLEDNGIVLP